MCASGPGSNHMDPFLSNWWCQIVVRMNKFGPEFYQILTSDRMVVSTKGRKNGTPRKNEIALCCTKIEVSEPLLSLFFYQNDPLDNIYRIRIWLWALPGEK